MAYVYKAVEEDGRVKVVRVEVVSMGPKMVRLKDRALAFQCNQQIPKDKALFSEPDALAALGRSLREEMAQLKERCHAINRALAEIDKRTPAEPSPTP